MSNSRFPLGVVIAFTLLLVPLRSDEKEDASLKAMKASANDMLANPFNKMSAHHRPIGSHQVPDISDCRDPENILLAPTSMDPALREKLAVASRPEAEAKTAFDMKLLEFPKALMKQGKIDPLTYKW